MQTWTIGEIATRAGVPTSTIRYYERIALLPPPGRINGRRRYQEDVLQKLSVIRLAQQAGFSISEIQSLLYDFPADAPPSERWQLLAQQKLEQLNEQMKSLQAMQALLQQTLQCQCASLEECANLGYEITGT